MEQHDLIQGTPEWHSHRATHFNASDAPAMLGISPYKSRSQLLHEMATGITQEVDAQTQRRFDDGHRFEALARPLAEKIIGKKLYPVIGSEGKLSASFDGLTADDTICFEHKTLNDSLRAIEHSEIPEHYRVQMEQQLLVSGAVRCLFMASRWDGEELVAEVHCEYEPDMEMRARIVAGWAQFEKDLGNYKHVEHAEKPKAEAIMDLPALSVQATGMVTYSNLPEFKAAAEQYIANINTELVTDEDFANGEATVKFCKSTEERLEVTKKAILAQTASIDEVIRTVDHIQAQLRDKRLMLDKLVKSEKEARKAAMCDKARVAFNDHFNALQSEISGVRLVVQHPDFGGAIKGLKSLASMQDALDTALANGKIETDSIARDIRAKLDWCKENAAGHSALFHDLQQIISKPMEDFALTITSRIEKAKADEAARMEAEKQRIEAEAKAKAEREAAAKLAAEEARIRAEERAKAEEEAKARATVEAEKYATDPEYQPNTPDRATTLKAAIADAKDGVKPTTARRPTRVQMIEVIALNYCVSEETAFNWLRAEFAEVAA